MIKIYNSLSNQVEEFIPIKKNQVSMYVCGPTVYDFMHIGNSRPVVFFDTVARFFKYRGFKVTYVSNFTDIDDKIINRAKEKNISEEELSQKFIKEINKTYKKLNCLLHVANPTVSENMGNIIDFIRLLIEKGSAYESNGDVYFEVEKINTLKDGEFLTTILSSVAQQEVENTSAYVKKRLKIKIKRDET